MTFILVENSPARSRSVIFIDFLPIVLRLAQGIAGGLAKWISRRFRLNSHRSDEEVNECKGLYTDRRGFGPSLERLSSLSFSSLCRAGR